MKLTYKGDYALKIILDLSLNYQKGWISIKSIAKRQDIPIKYLEQIVLLLKGAGFIKSKRGAEGGISLAHSPEKITLGAVIRQIDGTTAPITCVSRTEPSKCRDENSCPFKSLWSDVRNCINKIVDNTTFMDIVERHKKINKLLSLNYTI